MPQLAGKGLPDGDRAPPTLKYSDGMVWKHRLGVLGYGKVRNTTPRLDEVTRPKGIPTAGDALPAGADRLGQALVHRTDTGYPTPRRSQQVGHRQPRRRKLGLRCMATHQALTARMPK
jgi:hypothetical protein